MTNLLFSAPVGYQEYVHVWAQIDGSDWFEMTGNQWRWQHNAYTVPEQHSSPFEATVVNGQAFLSSWPSGTGGGAYSAYNTVAGLNSLQTTFGSDVQIWIEVISVRGSLTVTQLPTLSNSYTFRIFLDDNSLGGHGYYEFKVWGYGTVPEPASLCFLSLAIAILFCFAKR